MANEHVRPGVVETAATSVRDLLGETLRSVKKVGTALVRALPGQNTAQARLARAKAAGPAGRRKGGA
ncbi:MAG TPA: hypothetical protein VFO49_16405 [Nocardioides sp.]|nr:hypothetical protein [Nocardioides sp.]